MLTETKTETDINSDTSSGDEEELKEFLFKNKEINDNKLIDDILENKSKKEDKNYFDTLNNEINAFIKASKELKDTKKNKLSKYKECRIKRC